MHYVYTGTRQYISLSFITSYKRYKLFFASSFCSYLEFYVFTLRQPVNTLQPNTQKSEHKISETKAHKNLINDIRQCHVHITYKLTFKPIVISTFI